MSIWSVGGRLKLPFVCGDYQRGLLAFRQGEADLAFVGGDFSLMATVSIPAPPLAVTEGVLGVDLGIVELATDSAGCSYSGEAVKSVRRRVRAHRSGLQKTGTKRAKRTLCAEKNRKSQSQFLCLQCGFQANADYNASCNIARKGLEARGIVNVPKVAHA